MSNFDLPNGFITEAMASNTTMSEAPMRELVARRRFRHQGSRPPVVHAPTSAPSSREEIPRVSVDAALVDLEQPMTVDPGIFLVVWYDIFFLCSLLTVA